MKIRFLGAHNTESKTTRLLSIVVDGRLALDAGGLTGGLTFDEQLGLKVVLLTHSHYDHIRDIPMLAMNFYLRESGVDIYATASVREALASYLLNGQLYPRFLETPKGQPTVRFHPVVPYQEMAIEGYGVIAVPTNHAVPTVGYQLTSVAGRSLFYSGDTGPGLAECWRHISPELLIIEVTASSRYTDFGRKSKHLTPDLLRDELIGFREINGYLPRVLTVHMNPDLEKEIEAEIAALAVELDCSIELAGEGRELEL
ncbi:MAG: MBL fold metallo-hydrolase [Dehalococcoidales bacterium]